METNLKPFIVTVKSVQIEYYLVNATDATDAIENFALGELWGASDEYLSRTPLDAEPRTDESNRS